LGGPLLDNRVLGIGLLKIRLLCGTEEGGRGVQALQGSVQLGANPVQVSPHPLDIQGYGPPIPLQLLVLLQHGLQHSLLLDYLANSVMLVETLGTLRPMVHNGLDRRQ